MKTALVFGGSGQIGMPLLDRLRDDGWRVFAVSRAPRAEQPGLVWLPGELPGAQLSGSGLPGFDASARRADAIFSCGPLDLFAQWYARSDADASRVIAFG